MFDYSLSDGFIFDCDGTLLDTLDAWDEAERELFLQAGELTEDEETAIHAAPIDEAARLLHERFGVGESSEAVLAHLDNYLVPFYGTKANPMPGAVAFVKDVHKHGLPCVVVSSSPRRYLEPGLERIGIRDCFKELVSTDEVGVSKQDPGIYRAAVEILGCDPSRIWAVDDAPYAVQAMHNYGLKTICVGNRTSKLADIDILSLEELLS